MTDLDNDSFLAEYPKINGLYKRDEKGRFVFDQFARPEFDFLYSMEWLWTEKVDGCVYRRLMDDCGCGMGDDCQSDGEVPALTVYFNPFDGATIEENNERIRRGWEVMPMRVPPMDRDLRKT